MAFPNIRARPFPPTSLTRFAGGTPSGYFGAELRMIPSSARRNGESEYLNGKAMGEKMVEMLGR